MKVILLILLIFPLAGFSLEISIVGACSERAVNKLSIDIAQDISLGELSVAVFKMAQISYQGNENAIFSILDFPTGMKALEVLSDAKMRAHGPCYAVDGVVPEVQPGEFLLTPETRELKWFIGYSTLTNGKWLGQCESTAKLAPEKYCKK